MSRRAIGDGAAAEQQVASRRQSLEGMIDELRDREISGWVYDRTRPHLQFDVEAVDPDGRIVARARASLPRADLRVLEPGLANHGFRLEIREGRDRNALLRLRCLVVGHGYGIPPASELVDTAVARALWRRVWIGAMRWVGRTRILGHFDGIKMGVASGWAYAPADPNRSLSIELVCGSQVIAAGVANHGRRDLLAIGLRGGRRAFQIRVPPAFLAGDGPIEARVAGCKRPLAPSNGLAIDRRVHFGCVESASASSISGWAVDLTSTAAAIVDVVCEGRVIASCRADIEREDLRRLDIVSEGGGFRASLPAGPLLPRRAVLSVRVRSSGADLEGSPVAVDPTAHLTKWLNRTRRFPPLFYDRLRSRLAARGGGMMLSIVMPVYDTKETWLREAIDSVIGQWSTCWELICIDDRSTKAGVLATLREYARGDSRIKIVLQETNKGTAFCTNIGIAAATGRYILFMDHDDVLEPDAVAKLVAAAATGPDLVYSDEVVTGEDIDHLIAPLCRPAFSHDYYLSHPYFVHAICVRTEIARQVGGLDISMPISADVDFVLRVLEESRRVLHLPFVLYRWRTHATSTGHTRSGSVTEATTRALQRHLDRTRPGATATRGSSFNQYKISYPDPGGRIALVIPTRDRVDLLSTCIASVTATCGSEDIALYVVDNASEDDATSAYLASLGPSARILRQSGDFNFSSLNNFAVRAIEDCAFVCFMNNDIEALEAGWLPRLRSIAARDDVGIVGPRLVYPDGKIQHGGVILGLNGPADHAHKFQPAETGGGPNPGYNGALAALRDASAVTGACMLMRTRVFERVGGFDETFAVGFGDTDLCLRVRGMGLKVLYDGHTTLLHHESASRRGTGIDHPDDAARFRERWAHRLVEGDPFYNPALSLDGADHRLTDRIVGARFQARQSDLAGGRRPNDVVRVRRA